MEVRLFIPVIVFITLFSWQSRAENLGPQLPSTLLPPMSDGAQRVSNRDSFRARPTQTEPEPLLDLDDPSTLLDPEDIPKAPVAEAPRVLPPQKIPSLKPFQAGVGNSDQKLELKMGLIPPLPMLQPKVEEKPHPPLMAAMNPPPKVEERREVAQTKVEEKKEEVKSENDTDMNLGPMLGGVGLPVVVREPKAEEPPTPAESTKKLALPPSTPMAPLAGVPDIAIILAHNQFFPSKIRMKEGIQTRLIFTTVNKKPAALVIERLQIQRWIAKEKERTPSSELERSRWEVNREISSTKITEITLDPKKGTYAFHDAISGAAGEIEVE